MLELVYFGSCVVVFWVALVKRPEWFYSPYRKLILLMLATLLLGMVAVTFTL